MRKGMYSAVIVNVLFGSSRCRCLCVKAGTRVCLTHYCVTSDLTAATSRTNSSATSLPALWGRSANGEGLGQAVSEVRLRVESRKSEPQWWQ
jgi:hypothetical protein